MDSQKIRGRLLIEGYTSKRLASELGVSRQSIDYVIAHKPISLRIMVHIAKIIDKPPAVVFPEAANRFNPTSNNTGPNQKRSTSNGKDSCPTKTG